MTDDSRPVRQSDPTGGPGHRPEDGGRLRPPTVWRRVWRHLVTDQRAAARLFPPALMSRLERATRHGEQLHRGQVRLAIEASLPLSAVRRGMTPRDRAIEVFGLLRLWDTAENCGVLVYVLVADRAFEIVADRGIDARVDAAEWRAISDTIASRFRNGEFADGAQAALVRIGSLLALHFPRSSGDGASTNEQPDAPVFIR